MSRTRRYRPPVIRYPGWLHFHGADINEQFYFACPDTPEMRKHHYPEKRGDKPWTIVDGEGKVIDKYRPQRKRRRKPCTPYAGSWAAQIAAAH